MPKFVELSAGDPAPWFKQRSLASANYTFDTAAGRYMVLCFFGTAADAQGAAAIANAKSRRELFSDTFASFFGVSVDPTDLAQKRFEETYPGYRFFLDFDMTISRLYGAAPVDDESASKSTSTVLRRRWIILDPMLRVLHAIPFKQDGSDFAEVTARLEALPPVSRYAQTDAPIIFLRDVFDPAFCARLIELYETNGGEESGFMREVDGKTVRMHDHMHKRRRDHLLADPAAIERTRSLFLRRIAPEIQRIHQFAVTRMERYLVACYDADDKAHFAPHRDNTTKGTAHRRFAVSVNLNDDFDGGELNFPEYGPRTYKPPPGAAIVFSCSMLHAVSRVTRGKRYAFLPFLYDDAAAALRQQNLKFVSLDDEPAKESQKS